LWTNCINIREKYVAKPVSYRVCL